MKWWDFSNTEFLILFIIISSLLVIVFLLIISIVIDCFLFNNYLKRISFDHNSLRVLILNPKQDKVIYFDKSDIKHKRSTNMSGFYSTFHINDQDKIKSWIYSIIMNPNDCERFLQADVYTRKNKCHYFSLLRYVRFDEKNGLIHLESTLMKYISPRNVTTHLHGRAVGLVTQEEMENIITNNKKAKGYCFAIRFFFIKPVVKNDDELEKYTIVNFKNDIYPYLKNNLKRRYIVDNDSHQLFLFDLNIDKNETALQLANSLEHDIKRRILIMGLNDVFSFSIGIVDNSNHYQDYDLIVHNAEEACIYAHQINAYQYLYNRKISRNIISSEKYAKQFDKYLKCGDLHYLYSPVLNLSKKSIDGYFTFVKLYNSPFKNYLEMHKYSILANKEKELFDVVARGIIPSFISQGLTISNKLYLTVSLFDASYIISILSSIKDIDKININLVFIEEQLLENSSRISSVIDTLKSLKESGYSLSLINDNKSLLLNEELYQIFDCFIVGQRMEQEIRKSSSERLSVHTLIEQLLRYKKPIIASNLSSWQSIELIIKSGISFISSDIISPSNEIVLPIDKKRFDRIVAIYDKYNN